MAEQLLRRRGGVMAMTAATRLITGRRTRLITVCPALNALASVVFHNEFVTF